MIKSKKKESNASKGLNLFSSHALFKQINVFLNLSDLPKSTFGSISEGFIKLNRNQKLSPEEFAYIAAFFTMYYALGYSTKKHVNEWIWFAACSLFMHKFLQDLKLFKCHSDFRINEIPYSTPEEAYFHFSQQIPQEFLPLILLRKEDIQSRKTHYFTTREDYPTQFSHAIQEYVTSSLTDISDSNDCIYHQAREWFINHYPMLGALASTFRIETNPVVIKTFNIHIAAISASDQVIYFNKNFPLNFKQVLFVMAHELLHVGLAHQERCGFRDPYIWNIACDYVINQWLVEMGIGQRPTFLHLDTDLKDMSAEDIYDIIVKKKRLLKKLNTPRGEESDIIDPDQWWNNSQGISVDEFIKKCLLQGLEYQINSINPGKIPAGLIEEIRALSQPPIPWDVKLARWFDTHFDEAEKTRTYSRASRRQYSNPDIPRPAWKTIVDDSPKFTLGVVLDTSMSMNREILGKALGSITSYSLAKDIISIRLIYCDALPYDQGFINPQDLIDSASVVGRGGTKLQPALDLLNSFNDFPRESPVLIITDGELFETFLNPDRKHAYLLPKGKRLPFKVEDVFEFS